MKLSRGAGVAALVALLLSACAPVSHPGGTSSSASPSSAPPSTAPANAFLLRVTATLTFGDGTVVHLQETADPPVKGDGSEPATMASVGKCDEAGAAWKTAFPSPSWVHLHLVTSYESGNALPEDEIVSVSGGSGQDYVAWSGAWHNGQAYCGSGYAAVPGTAEGLAPVDAAAPLGDRNSWTGAAWGFGLDHERDAPPTMPISFTECRLELGPSASSAAPILVRWPAAGGFAQDCVFGKQG